MEEQIQRLREMGGGDSSHIVFFGGAGVHRKAAFRTFGGGRGCIISSTMSFRDDPEPYLFRTQDRGVFPLFIGTNAVSGRPQRRPQKLAGVGGAGKAESGHHPEHRRPASGGGQPGGAGAHGSVHRNYCCKCHASYDAEFMKKGTGIPPLSGLRRHHQAGRGALRGKSGREHPVPAVHHLRQADMLIVGGTSLVVYPAAGLLNYYRGHRLVLVNKTPTPMDSRADLVVAGSIGQIFDQL